MNERKRKEPNDADFKTGLELYTDFQKKRKNVVNIDKIIHENAFFHHGRNKIKFNVSPSAVHEYASRVVDHIEDNALILCEIAQKHGRKTVMEQDVVELFGFVERDVI